MLKLLLQIKSMILGTVLPPQTFVEEFVDCVFTGAKLMVKETQQFYSKLYARFVNGGHEIA